MDTYHDPTRKGRSVVGFVASINDFATRWFSKAAFQEAGQELADALKLAFQGAIKAYFDVIISFSIFLFDSETTGICRVRWKYAKFHIMLRLLLVVISFQHGG